MKFTLCAGNATTVTQDLAEPEHIPQEKAHHFSGKGENFGK